MESGSIKMCTLNGNIIMNVIREGEYISNW